MKLATLAAAATFATLSTLAVAQSTNAPGASTIGAQPNPSERSSSTTGGSNSQTGGATMQNNSGGMSSGSGMTTGANSTPDLNDASKSGSPAADNAEKFRNSPTPGSVNK